MKKRLTFLAVFCFLTVFSTAHFLMPIQADAEGKKTFLVMPVLAPAFSKDIRATLTNAFAGQLIKNRRYNFLSGKIVEKGMRAAFKAEAPDSEVCDDVDCLQLMAKNVGTELVILTRVLKDKNTWFLDSRIDNVITGTIISQVDDECDACDLKALKAILKTLAKELTGEKALSTEPSISVESAVEKQGPLEKKKIEPRARLMDNGDGTISDTKTGLMWAREDSASVTKECMDWKVSKKYVKNLRTGGYSDWRLPTISELQTIYEETKSNKMGFVFKDYRDRYPLHLNSIFADGAAFLVWSSETKGTCCAKLLHFSTGYVGKHMRYYCRDAGVRPVRAGK